MNASLKFPSLQQTPVLVMIFIAAVLGTAYFFEHVLGILPCALCQYQRLEWWIALGLAGITFYLRRNNLLLLTGLTVTMLVILAGAATAGYHVGVEQKWWEGPSSCTNGGLNDLDINALKEAIMNAPVIRCDDVAWSLFGISMAGYNLLLALGAAAGIGFLIHRHTHPKTV